MADVPNFGIFDRMPKFIQAKYLKANFPKTIVLNSYINRHRHSFQKKEKNTKKIKSRKV